MHIATLCRHVLVAALLIGATLDTRAAEMPAEGLYYVYNYPGAPVVQQLRSQDGSTLPIGARADVDMVGTLFKSLGNDNDSFRLTVMIPRGQMAGGWFALIVAGTAYRQTEAYTAGNDNLFRLDFHISGDDRAKEVSKYLAAPITYYRHPGHRLRVTITPTEESFARGADVTATLRIVNVGTEPVAFVQGGRNYLSAENKGRDNQFSFAASLRGKPVPDIGIASYSGGAASQIVLKPGETSRVLVHLNQWFDFKETGTYWIHGSYSMTYMVPEPRDYSAFWIAFQGVPEGTIWTDHIGADFTVKIH